MENSKQSCISIYNNTNVNVKNIKIVESSILINFEDESIQSGDHLKKNFNFQNDGSIYSNFLIKLIIVFDDFNEIYFEIKQKENHSIAISNLTDNPKYKLTHELEGDSIIIEINENQHPKLEIQGKEKISFKESSQRSESVERLEEAVILNPINEKNCNSIINKIIYRQQSQINILVSGFTYTIDSLDINITYMINNAWENETNLTSNNFFSNLRDYLNTLRKYSVLLVDTTNEQIKKSECFLNDEIKDYSGKSDQNENEDYRDNNDQLDLLKENLQKVEEKLDKINTFIKLLDIKIEGDQFFELASYYNKSAFDSNDSDESIDKFQQALEYFNRARDIYLQGKSLDQRFNNRIDICSSFTNEIESSIESKINKTSEVEKLESQTDDFIIDGKFLDAIRVVNELTDKNLINQQQRMDRIENIINLQKECISTLVIKWVDFINVEIDKNTNLINEAWQNENNFNENSYNLFINVSHQLNKLKSVIEEALNQIDDKVRESEALRQQFPTYDNNLIDLLNETAIDLNKKLIHVMERLRLNEIKIEGDELFKIALDLHQASIEFNNNDFSLTSLRECISHYDAARMKYQQGNNTDERFNNRIVIIESNIQEIYLTKRNLINQT